MRLLRSVVLVLLLFVGIGVSTLTPDVRGWRLMRPVYCYQNYSHIYFRRSETFIHFDPPAKYEYIDQACINTAFCVEDQIFSDYECTLFRITRHFEEWHWYSTASEIASFPRTADPWPTHVLKFDKYGCVVNSPRRGFLQTITFPGIGRKYLTKAQDDAVMIRLWDLYWSKDILNPPKNPFRKNKPECKQLP